MPTTIVSIYQPATTGGGDGVDDWDATVNYSAAGSAGGVPASIIEQTRTVQSRTAGTPRVIRQITGRVPNGTVVTVNSKIIDGEGRTYAVSSVRQPRNPVWISDVILELVRTDQAAT